MDPRGISFKVPMSCIEYGVIPCLFPCLPLREHVGSGCMGTYWSIFAIDLSKNWSKNGGWADIRGWALFMRLRYKGIPTLQLQYAALPAKYIADYIDFLFSHLCYAIPKSRNLGLPTKLPPPRLYRLNKLSHLVYYIILYSADWSTIIIIGHAVQIEKKIRKLAPIKFCDNSTWDAILFTIAHLICLLPSWLLPAFCCYISPVFNCYNRETRRQCRYPK